MKHVGGGSVSSITAELAACFGGRAKILQLRDCPDERGTLLPFEFAQLPFAPRRIFVVHSVPAGLSRGGHAHKNCEQLLVALAGEIVVELRYEGQMQQVPLTVGRALLVGSHVWSKQTYLSADAILLVLASEPYESGSYI
jgi:UDP-2-acetamido-3-amino-2,3-dideoxy-glucuronate N-acetyltransferase